MTPGEEKAWGVLVGLDPSDVERRAKIAFDVAAGSYRLQSFGQEMLVFPKDRKIVGFSPESDLVLGRFAHFSHLMILHYLIGAHDLAPSGKLVRPEEMSAGYIFTRGSHVLPLGKVATRYGDDFDSFLARGRSLGGVKASYADASIRLLPLPRLPVVLLLWRGDDEFPARADLLLDSTYEAQLPADVVWSTAMLSLLMML